MKICYLSSVLTVHDHKIISEMLNRGFDTHLVTYFDGDIPKNIKDLEGYGLNITHYPPKHFHKIQKFLFAFKLRGFKKVLDQIKPDVLHSGFVWKDGFLAALSGFRPHLLMPWGSDILIHSRQDLICKWIVKYTIEHSDIIACDCNTVRNEVIKLSAKAKGKIIIFPWGVDLKLFNREGAHSKIIEERKWQNKKILVSTRNFYPVYNIELVIKAMSLIIKEEPGARLFLVGSGPEEEKLQKRVKEDNLEGYIHFVGAVSNNEMPVYLKPDCIYVSASISDGTSTCLQEAFACGLPVVVSDVPAIREWVEDGINGFIVSSEDASVLAEKVIELLKDKVLHDKMGENNYKIAIEKADWNKNFNKLANAYESLIARE